MIKELFENISAGQDIRKSLIALKQELKQEEARIELLALLQGDFSLITELLNDPDPKVRKNAAMTLGRLDQDQHVPLLYQAYQREEQLFVKSEYLRTLIVLPAELAWKSVWKNFSRFRLQRKRKNISEKSLPLCESSWTWGLLIKSIDFRAMMIHGRLFCLLGKNTRILRRSSSKMARAPF